MTSTTNPALPGAFAFDSVIYASAGLNYAAVPALNQFTIYDAPDPAYVTGRLHLPAFAELGFATPWPFNNTNVPLNGHLRIPRGRGPFPLAVFAHGNHAPRRTPRRATCTCATCWRPTGSSPPPST